MSGPIVRAGMLSLLAVVACDADPGRPAAPGDPLPGLGAAELARFRTGEALFQRAFGPDEGLGPLFNDDSCASCHDVPTRGGTGVEPVTISTRWIEDEGRCDLLVGEGGPVRQLRSTPALRAALRERGTERRVVPASANRRTELSAPSLYGLGLVDAVPEEEILSRADPEDRSGDGISGRPGRTREGELGRFGRKANHASLRDFAGRALLTEMGLTTPHHPTEQPVAAGPVPPAADPVPDPELDGATVELLTDYVRFLAPPPRRIPGSAADRAAGREGETLFHEIGCAACHVPEMTSGPSPVPALDRRPVRLYSDLLLHDLGRELEGVCGPGAAPSEWRTAILSGLRFRLALMHDGRTRRLERAIDLHGGEASASRDAFRELGAEERRAVVRFLGTL